MQPFSDRNVLRAWRANGSAWARAVREGRIETRERVTNQAVVEAVTERSPRSVLDLGCGEGWLVRALAIESIDVVGIDAVPALVEQARCAGGGRFHVAAYEDLATGSSRFSVDVAVCNFALLGKESVEGLFACVPRMLAPGGAFVVQTLHPVFACGEAPYADGWRLGSWHGCGGGFGEPAPWYFRTLASWIELFAGAGLRLRKVREPIDPTAARPASVIFVAEADG